MNYIGQKIYYDVMTGNVILSTGEAMGSVQSTTVEQDISSYTKLSERNIESFDVIELEFGQYEQDFMSCNGYRVNPLTKEVEFSYPDPNDEEPQEPVYQKPLSSQLGELQEKVAQQDSVIEELMFEIIPMMLMEV